MIKYIVFLLVLLISGCEEWFVRQTVEYGHTVCPTPGSNCDKDK